MKVWEYDEENEVCINDLIDAAAVNATSDWEIEFVADLANRYDQWADEMFISQKQVDILKRLAKE